MSIRQYWFVLWELTKRELKRKYARSFLGILWSCVYPLMYGIGCGIVLDHFQ